MHILKYFSLKHRCMKIYQSMISNQVSKHSNTCPQWPLWIWFCYCYEPPWMVVSTRMLYHGFSTLLGRTTPTSLYHDIQKGNNTSLTKPTRWFYITCWYIIYVSPQLLLLETNTKTCIKLYKTITYNNLSNYLLSFEWTLIWLPIVIAPIHQPKEASWG